MVLRIPKPDGLLPLEESEIVRLQSTLTGRSILSSTPIDELRTLRMLSPSQTSYDPMAHTITSTTLNTPATIASFYSYYSLPSPQNSSPLGLYTSIIQFGSGMNGHPHKLHGGILSLILDVTMGRASWHHCSDGMVSFTVTMTVDYKKPISTPGELLCKAWLEGRSEDRKHWVKAIVEQNGETVAGGSSLFLEVPKPASYPKGQL